MNTNYDLFVHDTLVQLCDNNRELVETGVTESQLRTALALKFCRGVSQTILTEFIEKELRSKSIERNDSGNYLTCTSSTTNTMEESSSDSGKETTERDEAPDNEAAKQVTAVEDGEVAAAEYGDKPVKRMRRSRKAKEDEEAAAAEDEEVAVVGEDTEDVEATPAEDKPVKRMRRSRKPKEDDPPEMVLASQQADLEARLFSKNSGRRVIRKKTKYDPSEFYLTPLIRKKKGNQVEEPKRRGRPPHKIKITSAAAVSLKKMTQMVGEKGDKALSQAGGRLSVEADLYKALSGLDRHHLLNAPRPSKSSILRNECYICSAAADINDHRSTLACCLCLNMAHRSCVEDDGFYKMLHNWRCSECLATSPLICSICDKEYNKSSGGGLVQCDFCEEFFHLECHDPPVDTASASLHSSWRCGFCPKLTYTDVLIGGREDLKNDLGTFAFNSVTSLRLESLNNNVSCKAADVSQIHGSMQPRPELIDPSYHSPTEPIVQIKTEPSEECEEVEADMETESSDEVERSRSHKFAGFKLHRPDEPIPKVDDWTPKQVADYFSDRFGAIVGNAFLSQEIDGKSLKLMRREDVVDQLGLQFGIALKVLYYVRKIQLDTNVLHKLWT